MRTTNKRDPAVQFGAIFHSEKTGSDIAMAAYSKIHTLVDVFEKLRIHHRIRRIGVDGRRIRNEKVTLQRIVATV